MRSVAIPAFALVLVSACVVENPRQPGYQAEEVPGITIISHAEASAQHLRGEPFEVAFAPGTRPVDGLLEYLRTARRWNATQVGELRLHVVVGAGGPPLECVSHLGPREELTERTERACAVGHCTVADQRDPSKWRQVSKTYSRWELVEGQQVCTRLAAGVTHDRMTGFIYRADATATPR